MRHDVDDSRYARRAGRALTVLATALLGAALVAAAPPEAPADSTQATPAEGDAAGPAAEKAAKKDRKPKQKQKASAKDLFIDPEDGAFDMSGVLAAPGGFLPVPVPITEPAVGYGAFLGALFFHRPKNPDPEHPVPPSMTVAGGALTSNGTWAVIAGHAGYWRHDTIRFVGGGGYADVGLTWYGMGEEESDGLEFDLEAVPAIAQVSFRIAGSPFFLGTKYRFAWIRAKFEEAEAIPGVDPDDLESRLGGLGVIASMDTRDNVMTPNSGLVLDVNATMDHPWLGSTGFFGVLQTTALMYEEPMPRLVVGLRVLANTAIGDEAPFYVKPYVQLRGVPIFRYVGDAAISVEGELRWDFWKRWSLVPFGGVGAAVSDLSLTGGSFVWGVGLGGRYLIARKMGARVGIDVARGPEQFAFYVVLGSAWFRP